MKSTFTALFGLSFAIAACHQETAPPPKATATLDASPLPAAPPAPPTAHHTSAQCEGKTTRATPSSSGDTMVVGADGRPHSLYWTKLDAKTQPSRGTLFYLAGGPISHAKYTDLASAFQTTSFPQLDVVLYDYYGFNCSTPLQDTSTLATESKNVTTPAMAHDFIQLKRSLIGNDRKAFLMGGSYGSILGAEIVRAYPADIEKAVLFSGDPATGWLEGGYFRFDRLMSKLDETRPGFAKALSALLASDAVGDRARFEVALWLAFGLDSASQAALPDLVMKGDRKWIAPVASVASALLEPVHSEATPTESSVVTTYYRCNVWFPKSARKPRPDVKTRFLAYDSLVRYWDTLCKDYDRFGEAPAPENPASPTSVPILSWVGDQDTFDPLPTRARWAALSSKLTFQVMEGWSHDFGPTPKIGFSRVSELVKTFFDEGHEPAR